MHLLFSAIPFRIDTVSLMVLTAACALIFVFKHLRTRFEPPLIRFSETVAPRTFSLKHRWRGFAQILQWVALAAFALAWLDPRWYHELPQETKAGKRLPQTAPVEGIAIYLVLDQSGSMRESVPTGRRRSTVKIDLLKTVTKQFIEGDAALGLEGRPQDMIGLVSFARGAQVLSPLTLDHAAVLQELSRLKPVGEREHDGTSIGYAIYKTASLIAATRHYADELVAKGEPPYTIKSSVIVLITDGMQDPNPLDKGKRMRNIDVPEAAAFAKEQNVKLYIVNVDPKLATEEFAPYRHIMQRAAASTGGKFYMVDETGNLANIYQEINRLEKSVLPSTVKTEASYEQRPDLYQTVSFYPYLIFAGLVALFLSAMMECLVLRRVP